MQRLFISTLDLAVPMTGLLLSSNLWLNEGHHIPMWLMLRTHLWIILPSFVAYYYGLDAYAKDVK